MSHDVVDFEAEVRERSRQVPVLADFWAPWCGPCRMLGPVLEGLAEKAGGRWVLAKINVDEQTAVAEEFAISSIPAVKLFINGAVVGGFEGSIPERDIRRFLNQHLPSANSATLRDARDLMEQRRYSEATALLRPVLAAEPSNDGALVALAECQLALEPTAISATLASVSVESPLAEKAGALRSLARFAQLPDLAGTLPEAPVKARYLEAGAALRAGDLAAALEGFIDVLSRRRDYDQGGAKSACQGIFLLLGIRHPLAEKYYRAFSSALHA